MDFKLIILHFGFQHTPSPQNKQQQQEFCHLAKLKPREIDKILLFKKCKRKNTLFLSKKVYSWPFKPTYFY